MFNFFYSSRGINYENKFQENNSEIHELMANIKAVMGKISYFESRLSKMMQVFEGNNNTVRYEDLSSDIEKLKEMVSKSVRIIYGECHQSTDNTEDILKDLKTISTEVISIGNTQKIILEKLQNFKNTPEMNTGGIITPNNDINLLKEQIFNLQNTFQESIKQQIIQIQNAVDQTTRNQQIILLKTMEEIKKSMMQSGNIDISNILNQVEQKIEITLGQKIDNNLIQKIENTLIKKIEIAVMDKLDNNLIKIEQIIDQKITQATAKIMSEIQSKNDQIKKAIEDLHQLILSLGKNKEKNDKKE